MVTFEQLLTLPDPPEGLTDAELEEWWLKHLSESDGSIIMLDDYGPTNDQVNTPNP